MRAILILLALASPAAASCPDMLVGDSLAQGMASYARTAGFTVLAQRGAGLAWVRAQRPVCARRLVLVLGTNDLRSIRSPTDARRYAEAVTAELARWPAERASWVLPGCFAGHPDLDGGSAALAALLRGSSRVDHGRPARCTALSGDGIHPEAAGYRGWWAGIWNRL